MTILVSSTTIAKRLGTIIAPVFDAPYTVPYLESFAGSVTPQSPRSFAGGSLWPLLQNIARDASRNLIQRANAAVLGGTAPTYLIAGDQNPANIPANAVSGPNNFIWTANFYADFIGCANQYLASNFNIFVDTLVYGVGSTNFPIQFLVTTSDSTVEAAQSNVFITQSLGQWSFTLMYANGAQSQFKFYRWSPKGLLGETTTINGPFPLGTQAQTQFPLGLMPCPAGITFGGVKAANVAIIGPGNTVNNRFILTYFDDNLEALFSSYIRLDNGTCDNIMIAAISLGYTYTVQCTPAGFLIMFNQSFVPAGFQQAFSAFLISGDGQYWAPVTLSAKGPNAQALSYTFSNTSLTIDPLGNFWVMNDPGNSAVPTYVGTSFGAPLNFPPLVAVTPQTPNFVLPCFTPCDISTISL